MAYCVKCGVQLDDGAKVCPLCNTKVMWNIDDDKKSNENSAMYPNRPSIPSVDIRRRSLVLLVTLLFCIPFLIVAFSDYVTSNSITWSAYVLISIVALYFFVTIPIVLRHSSAIKIIVSYVITIAVFLFALEFLTGGDWFIELALPLLLTLGLCIASVFFVIKKIGGVSLKVIAVIMFCVGIFCVVTEVLISRTFKIEKTVFWSAYPCIIGVICSLILVSIDNNKALKEKLAKKFFI